MQANCAFRVGDKLSYPNHGIVAVEHVGESPIMPEGGSYYHLRILANNSWLLVPVQNSDAVGLRKLYSEEELEPVLRSLRQPMARRREDWKDRYRQDFAKMKTGRLEELSEVVRLLGADSERRSLTFREKKMFDRARYILIAEIAQVRNMSEAEAEKLMDSLLQESYMAERSSCGLSQKTI